MITMKRQPGGLLTGTLMLMALAVVIAVLSGDLLLLLAVGCAVAGVMVLSRPSRRPAPVHVSAGRHEMVESRRAVLPERVVVHPAGWSTAKSRGAVRLRTGRAAGWQRRPYIAAADTGFPVIQVLR